MDKPFPPQMISRWINGKTVSLEILIEEMRYWTHRMEHLDEDSEINE